MSKTTDKDRTYRPAPSTATSRINSALAEDGLHYTVAALQDRISMALAEDQGDWTTFKIPSAYEVTFKTSELREALAATDPFEGL